jgi:hypothetical protein
VDLHIAVTDFALGVSPDNAALTAGQSSRHLVAITPQNGPYNSEVTLSCTSGNLPPQTTCVFDPPAVTPGAAGATSTLTISTASNATATATGRVRANAITTLAAGIAVFPSTLVFGTDDKHDRSAAARVADQHRHRHTEPDERLDTGDFATVHSCGATVAAGASCAVSVSFTPTAPARAPARCPLSTMHRAVRTWCR